MFIFLVEDPIYAQTCASCVGQGYNYSSQFGSSGTGNGQFDSPWGVVLDGSGNIYVADQNNNRIEKFSSTGTYSTQWGSSGTGNGQFNGPRGIAIDGLGNVYVCDGNNRAQKFTVSGSTYTFVTTWGSYGTSGGGFFNSPSGIAADASGRIWVSDGNNNVQKFTNVSGTYTYASSISSSGTQGLAVDGSGNIYIVDYSNQLVQKYSNSNTFITQIGFLDMAGTSGITGNANGEFNGPKAIAIDASCNLYVTDAGNNRVEVFVPSTGPVISNFYVVSGGAGNPYNFYVNGAGIGSASSVSIYGNGVGFTFSNTSTYLSGSAFIPSKNSLGISLSTSCGSLTDAGYNSGTFRLANASLIFDDNNSSGELTAQASVFPNPSLGEFTVSFLGKISFDMEVYNSLGELVLKESVAGDSYKISNQKFPTGIYNVKLNSDGEINNMKLVVNK